MEFGFTPEQEMIRGQAEEFLRQECPGALVREVMVTEHAHHDGLWRKMADMGWMGLIFPEAYDGAELSFVELAVVMEEMGRALVPGPYASTVLLAGLTLLEAGSHEQKMRWLGPLAQGKLRGTLAFTEPSVRWDAAGVSLPARREKGGYYLNGTKLFVPDAGVAELIVCAARTENGSSPEDGISLFVIEGESNGLSITPLKTMDLTRRLCEVSLEQVWVPVENLLGREGQAWPLIARVLDAATIGLCAEMVGGAQRVLDMCVEYSKTRVQFGRPIGSFQAIQHKCADMLLLTESARSAVYAAACAVREKSEDVSVLTSIAKSYASDAYTRVAGEGIQVHGGMGFTWEHDAHLFFKRAKAAEVTYGDASFHRERVARLIGL